MTLGKLTVERQGEMVWIGDFFGSIASSPSNGFAIACGGVGARSSSDRRNFRLIQADRVILAGTTSARISRAKVSDSGSFILETVTPANSSQLRAYTASGDLFFKKGSRPPISFFGLTPDPTCVIWIVRGCLRVFDATTGKTSKFELPLYFGATDVQLARTEGVVRVMYAGRSWYRFTLAGKCLDEEAWREESERDRVSGNWARIREAQIESRSDGAPLRIELKISCEPTRMHADGESTVTEEP